MLRKPYRIEAQLLGEPGDERQKVAAERKIVRKQ
jgi:hypothetical protein